MKSQAVWKQWAATAALGCCLVMPAWAAGSFSFKKPGFINIERVYRESKQAQKIQQDLEKEFASQQQKLHEMQQRGEALEKQIAYSKLGAERNRFIEELSKLDYEFRLEQARFMEEYNLRRNEEFAALQQNADRVMLELIKKEGYDVIFKDVVFIDGKFDITEKVIQEMNR